MKTEVAKISIFLGLLLTVILLSAAGQVDTSEAGVNRLLTRHELGSTRGLETYNCCHEETQEDCKYIDECTLAVEAEGSDPDPECPGTGKDYEGVDRTTCKTGEVNGKQCDEGTMTCYFTRNCISGSLQENSQIDEEYPWQCTSTPATNKDCRTCSNGTKTGGSGTKSDDRCVSI